MNSIPAGHAKLRRRINLALNVTFALWSTYMIFLGFFVSPPGVDAELIFIFNAEPYYFEKSSLTEKALEYRSGIYKSLWLSLPDVTEAVTNYEIPNADIDIFESCEIRYITYRGKTIDPISYDLNPANQQLCEAALNEVSAAAWNHACRRLCANIVVWLYLGFALFSWRKYMKEANQIVSLSKM